MGRGGPLEIFFDPLSCAILRFLLSGLEPKIPDPARSTFAYLECCKRIDNVNRERIQESLSGLGFYDRYETRILFRVVLCRTSFHAISDLVPTHS